MRKLRFAPLLMLAACGGGGGSASDGTVVTPTPVPTPVPTPTPSPSPTPTPTPSATAYDTAFDFTRDRLFTGTVLANRSISYGGITTFGVTFGGNDDDRVTYAQATQAFAGPGVDAVPGGSAGSYDLTTIQRTVDTIRYSQQTGLTSGGGFTIYRPFPSSRYVTYYRSSYLRGTGVSENYVVFGAITAPAEVRAIAAARTYQVAIEHLRDGRGAQALVIDPAGNGMSGTLVVVREGDDMPISLVLTGTVDATRSRFSGTATSADGAFTGAFHGLFFGPGGMEIGLVLGIRDAAFRYDVGVVTGQAR